MKNSIAIESDGYFGGVFPSVINQGGFLNETNSNPYYFSPGANISLEIAQIESEKVHISWTNGFRYVSNYYHTENIDNSVINKSNYFGYYTGPNLAFGKKHQIDLSFLFGVGIHYNTYKRYQIEATTKLGYKLVLSDKITLKTGSFINFGRNDFYTPILAGYIGVGYSFNKSIENIEFENLLNKRTISFSGYILDLQLDLIGVNIQYDHFLLRKGISNLGVSLSAKGGIDYNGDTRLNLSVSAISLFGKENDFFEIFMGPNLPLGQYVETTLYHYINFGLGYRYVKNNFCLRSGISTTSILYMGIGYCY